jgi:hypothetical protein
MNDAEIRKMSVNERIQAMEILWDSLLDDEAEISSPDWHGEILLERSRTIDDGTAEMVPIKDLKKSRTR